MTVLSDTSVRVSWKKLHSRKYTVYGYKIYYNQRVLENEPSETLTVSSNFDSAVIDNLNSGEEYQFEVAPIIVLDQELITGMRYFVVEKRVTTCELLQLECEVLMGIGCINL